MKIDRLIKRYPVLSFLVVTFSWSWIIWSGLYRAIPGGMYAAPGVPNQLPGSFIWFFILGGMGPSLMGIVMTRIIQGKGSIRKYLSQVFQWRIKLRWFLTVLLTAPILAFIARQLQETMGWEVAPILPMSGIVPALLMGLCAGLLEEFGWRGFALSKLLPRYTPLTAGLIVGIPWGLWHWIAAYWGVGAVYGSYFVTFFLVADISNLTAYSILMAYVCTAVKERVLPAVLFHASMAASINIFLADVASPIETIKLLGMFSVLSWLAVGLILYSLRDIGIKRDLSSSTGKNEIRS